MRPDIAGKDDMGQRLSSLSIRDVEKTDLSSPQSQGTEDDDGMITVRAHNKKARGRPPPRAPPLPPRARHAPRPSAQTGEITVMRVRKGTPMKEVMSKYAQNKGVKADRLSWKRRASARECARGVPAARPVPRGRRLGAGRARRSAGRRPFMSPAGPSSSRGPSPGRRATSSSPNRKANAATRCAARPPRPRRPAQPSRRASPPPQDCGCTGYA